MWIYALVAVATAVYAASRVPKPQNQPPPELDELKAPTAEDGRCIPVLFGTRKISSPNVVWYGDLSTKAVRQKVKGLFGSKYKNTGQYKINLGMHMVIGLGVFDNITKIEVGDKEAWKGSSRGGTINIDKPNLFGGENRQGGVQGSVDFLTGKFSQGQNSYLLGVLGEDVPAFRGVTSIILKRVYLGTSPQIRNWAFWGTRISKTSSGESQWYSEKAAIGKGGSDSLSIYIALDVSGSMDTVTSNGKTRLDNAKSSLVVLINNLISSKLADINSSTIDVYFTRWSDTSNSIERMDASVSDLITVRNYIQATTSGGSTDFSAAFSDYQSFFNSAIGEDEVVIFLTDGQPDEGTTSAALSIINGYQGPRIFGFNIDLEDVSYTEQIDNTPLDGVPVVSGGDPGGIVNSVIGVLFEHVDMNPAHIIREALTDKNFALGYPDSGIDEDSFVASADTLYDERMGMSLYWTKENSIEEFISEVLRHIRGNCYVDKRTGKWVLKLTRPDYDVNDLLILGEDEIVEVTNYKQPTISELVNSCTVVYWDYITGKEASITVQDQTLVGLQGGIVNETVQYPGFTNPELASRMVIRNLKEKSVPMLSCNVLCTRAASDLNIGDAFILNWPDLKIYNLPMRVESINLGNLTKAEILITCIQDVFSESGEVGSSPIVNPPSLWVDPASALPLPANPQYIEEATYYFAQQQMGAAGFQAQIDVNPNFGVSTIVAGRPSNESGATIEVNSGDGYAEAGELSFAPHAEIEDIGKMDTKIYLSDDLIDEDSMILPSLASIGEEIVYVEDLLEDSGGRYFQVLRAVLDTVPLVHASSSIVIWGDFAESDEFIRSGGDSSADVVDTRLITFTGSDFLAPGDADVSTVSYNSRVLRPAPPANLKVNGLYFPESDIGDVILTWDGRNRLLQINESGITGFTETGITAEPGTEYEVDFYNDETDTLIDTHVGISSNTDTLTIAELQGASRVRVETFSIRGGYRSYYPVTNIFDWSAGLNILQFESGYTPPANNAVNMQFEE